MLYATVIWSVLEYACPVWHSSLAAAQTKALESLQYRAMIRIIFQVGDYISEPNSTRWTHDATS